VSSRSLTNNPIQLNRNQSNGDLCYDKSLFHSWSIHRASLSAHEQSQQKSGAQKTRTFHKKNLEEVPVPFRFARVLGQHQTIGWVSYTFFVNFTESSIIKMKIKTLYIKTFFEQFYTKLFILERSVPK
jgi:hypothetical protein